MTTDKYLIYFVSSSQVTIIIIIILSILYNIKILNSHENIEYEKKTIFSNIHFI